MTSATTTPMTITIRRESSASITASMSAALATTTSISSEKGVCASEACSTNNDTTATKSCR